MLCCVVHCSLKGMLVVETNVSTSHHIPVEVEYSWPSIAGATRLQFAPTLVMEIVVRNSVCDPLPPSCVVICYSSYPISLHYKARPPHFPAPFRRNSSPWPIRAMSQWLYKWYPSTITHMRTVSFPSFKTGERPVILTTYRAELCRPLMRR